MRAVLQRVKKAEVIISGNTHSKINNGILVLLGITNSDNEIDMDYIIDKTVNIRIFTDKDGKMNEDLSSINGELLIVSQFTLYGDARKGRRPSYSDALNGEKFEKLYNIFIEKIKNIYDSSKIKTGIFGAMMDVSLINDGPVTILLDSKRVF